MHDICARAMYQKIKSKHDFVFFLYNDNEYYTGEYFIPALNAHKYYIVT